MKLMESQLAGFLLAVLLLVAIAGAAMHGSAPKMQHLIRPIVERAFNDVDKAAFERELAERRREFARCRSSGNKPALAPGFSFICVKAECVEDFR